MQYFPTVIVRFGEVYTPATPANITQETHQAALILRAFALVMLKLKKYCLKIQTSMLAKQQTGLGYNKIAICSYIFPYNLCMPGLSSSTLL